MAIINPPPTNDLTSNNTTAHGPRSTVPILVWTSAKSAVLHSCGHGWKKIDVDTSSWTPDERAYLSEHVTESQGARYGRHSVTGVKTSEIEGYDVAPPTAAALRVHVAAAVVAAAAEEEGYKAELMVELERLRNLPIKDLTRDMCSSGINLKRTALVGVWNKIHGRERYGWVTAADLGRHEEVEAFMLAEATRRAKEDDDQLRERIAGFKSMPICELAEQVTKDGNPRVSPRVSLRGNYHDPATVLERAGLDKWDVTVSDLGRGPELEAYHEQERKAAVEQVAKLEALLERLDPSVLPRFREGMLPDKELHRLLRSLLDPAVEHLEKIPRTDKVRWILNDEVPSSLTAPEYDGLIRTKKAAEELSLPGGAKAVVTTVFAREWISDREHEDADEEGEVQGYLRTVILVKAEILGIEVEAKRFLPR